MTYTITINDTVVFNRTSNDILYRVSALSRNDGSVLYSELAMNNDDRSFFNTLFEDASITLFENVSGYSKGIISAYSYTPDSGLVISLNMPDDFDQNMINVLTAKMVNFLVEHCIMEWFKRKGISYNLADYDNALAGVKGTLSRRTGITYRRISIF